MRITVDDEIVLIGGLEKLLGLKKCDGEGLVTSELFGAAKSDPTEEVIVRYAIGRGRVRPDGKGFNLAAELFDANGQSDGELVISWESLIGSIDELTRPPSIVKISLDELGPLDQISVKTLAKGSWSFKDGSSFNAVGIGISNMSVLASGVNAIRDTVALTITNGTGRYEGASGVGSVVGSVSLPAGQRFFGNAGAEATQKTIHSFKISRVDSLRK